MKLQVTSISSPINSSQIVVSLQEIDDTDPKQPMPGSTTLNLALSPAEAAQYTSGASYTLDLKKV